MVGREAGRGNNGEELPGLCDTSKGDTMRETRTCIPYCCPSILEQGAWAAQGHACRCIAAEIFTPLAVHVESTGSPILIMCEEDSAPREVFPHWVVHGKPQVGNNGPEMVDDRS